MTFVVASLTCKDMAEARKVANALLGQKLVATIKVGGEVTSASWQQGAMRNEKQLILTMETHESRMPRIEETLAEILSYDTFILTAVPVVYISKAARVWMLTAINLLGS